MKRTELKRKTPLHSATGWQPMDAAAKLPRRRKRQQRVPKHWLVMGFEYCAMGCGRRASDAHHVIYAQHLKGHGLRDHLYDTRNRLPLCRNCHAGHHSASRRVPRSALAPANFAFAAEFDLDWLLDREYPPEEQAA